MKLIYVFASALLFATAVALYDAKSPVVKLDKSNFKKLVIESDDVWMVEFYAPWCGHCKNLKPAWESAARALKGVVRVGAVDMTTDQEVGGPYNVKGFPTLKYFGANKRSPKDYNSGRDAESIVNFALQQAQAEVRERLGGKSKSKAGGSQGNQGSGGGSSGGSGSEKDVVVLTNDNFEKEVRIKPAYGLGAWFQGRMDCRVLRPLVRPLQATRSGVRSSCYET